MRDYQAEAREAVEGTLERYLGWVRGAVVDDVVAAVTPILVAQGRADAGEDSARLDWLIEWLGHHDDLEGSGVRDWDDAADARVAVDAARSSEPQHG